MKELLKKVDDWSYEWVEADFSKLGFGVQNRWLLKWVFGTLAFAILFGHLPTTLFFFFSLGYWFLWDLFDYLSRRFNPCPCDDCAAQHDPS